jgi:LmbE family N-acetylglucosaminyl deacetylase
VVRAVARAKPLVPDRAWPVLLSLRSFAGDGPIVGTPALRRVLVLAPHPDDEAVGCGGLVALLGDAGADVDVVFATDGEATRGGAASAADVASSRRREANAACDVLGARPPRFLGLPDGALASRLDELTRSVRAVAGELTPDAVLAPWFGDGHEDHRALSDAVCRAGLGDGVEVWAYETWTPLPANRVVDISAVIARKERAIAAHETAHRAFDVGAMLGLNRYRSLHGLMGRGWAEAYLAASPSAYAALVRDHTP